MELERREMVSEVLEAIGSDKRLATLEHVSRGTPAKNIHKNIDASRSGVQHFLDDFRDVDIITAPEDGRHRLTEKGERVADVLEELDADFRRFELEQLRSMAVDSSLSAEEIEMLLEEVKEEKSG